MQDSNGNQIRIRYQRGRYALLDNSSARISEIFNVRAIGLLPSTVYNAREGFLEHEQYVRLRDQLPDHQKPSLVVGYHLETALGPDRLRREPDPAGEETDESKKGAQCAALWRIATLVSNWPIRHAIRNAHSLFPGRGTPSQRSSRRGRMRGNVRVSLHC
jgi:hypothetical protein